MKPPAISEVLAAVRRRMGAPGTYRELQSGLTNRSYLIEVDGRPHVLRLDTAQTEKLGLDRAREYEIQRRAAGAGLAPRILAAAPDEGWLVYEYLEGTALTAEDLADPATLEAIGDLLRAVHALPGSGQVLDVDGAAERYAAIVRSDPGLRRFAQRCVGIVSGTAPPSEIRCCHNDVVAANIISRGGLSLIDWEYAADNDPLFDLACLAGYHDLGEEAVEVLLRAYAGRPDGRIRTRLAEQRRLFDALQWLWLAAQATLAPRHGRRARLEELRQRISRQPDCHGSPVVP